GENNSPQGLGERRPPGVRSPEGPGIHRRCHLQVAYRSAHRDLWQQEIQAGAMPRTSSPLPNSPARKTPASATQRQDQSQIEGNQPASALRASKLLVFRDWQQEYLAILLNLIQTDHFGGSRPVS